MTQPEFIDPDMEEAYKDAVRSVLGDESEERIRQESNDRFNEEYRHFWPKWVRNLFKK